MSSAEKPEAHSASRLKSSPEEIRRLAKPYLAKVGLPAMTQAEEKQEGPAQRVSQRRREAPTDVRNIVADTLGSELAAAISNIREDIAPLRPQLREMARGLVTQRIEGLRGQVFRQGALPAQPEQVSPEEQKTREEAIQKILGSLEAEIAAVATDIIKGGVGDGLQTLDTETLKRLSESKEVRLRRRMGRRGGDPLVLEWGDGIKQPVRDVPVFL